MYIKLITAVCVAVILSFLGGTNGDKFKVLVTRPDLPDEAIELLSKTAEVTHVNNLPANKQEVLEKVKGVDGLLWAHYDPLTAEILDAAGPQLKVVSLLSAGFNYVDVAELKKRNIPLGNTPKVLSAAVADIAIGLMLAAARRFHEARHKIDSDQWVKVRLDWMQGQDISGATVGFYGFGSIGQEIAKRLQGFDINEILYNTRSRVDTEIEQKFNAKMVDFTTLLTNSDIVFVAAPLTNQTMGVFNSNTFDKMKKNAVLVNIARGKIVNSNDLYEALKQGKIFSAGLDVVDPEPLSTNDPLLSLPNLVITPHIGSSTKRTRDNMAILAANNILNGLEGRPLPAAVY